MHYLIRSSQPSPRDQCYSHPHFIDEKYQSLKSLEISLESTQLLNDEIGIWKKGAGPNPHALKNCLTGHITMWPPLCVGGLCQHKGCTKVTNFWKEVQPHLSSFWVKTTLWFFYNKTHNLDTKFPLTLIKPSIAFIIIIKANGVKHSVGQRIL